MAKYEYYLWKVHRYFFDKFAANDFGYVVYPFLRIFKILGFIPMALDPVAVFNERSKVVWDVWAVLCSFTGTVIYVVGFVFGVCHISNTKSLERLHENMVIAYFATWGQLVFLFILGGYGVLNTWLNLSQLQLLLAWISNIDHQLEQATGRALNYTSMRKNLFIQLVVVFLVTASLSMVNCVIIFSGPDSISIMSGCFWFVCFFPILLLTFKEFQFYNLMFVLKSKFDAINVELAQYGTNSVLWPKRLQDVLIVSFPTPQCSMQSLRQLLQIYANIADCVELLLRVFAWHLLLLTSASFGVVTIQGYNLFAALVAQTLQMGSYQLTVIICWIFVQVAVIGINVSACCMTDKAMSSAGPLLHKIHPDCIRPSGLYQIIQIFSMEVMQRKNSFTAAGFFNMDYKLITSIVAAVTTYLLIIIQFHTSMGNHPAPNND